MATTTELMHTYHVMDAGAAGTGSRTVTYWAGVAQVVGGTLRESKSLTISAGVSAQQVTLTPFSDSQPAALMVLQSDQLIDVRVGSAAAQVISAVCLLAFAAQVSALYLTTLSSLPAVHVALELVGGTDATVNISTPRG